MRLNTVAFLAALLGIGGTGCLKKGNRSSLQEVDGTPAPFTAVVRYQSGQMVVTFTPPTGMDDRQFTLKSIVINPVSGTGGASKTIEAPGIGVMKFESVAASGKSAISCETVSGTATVGTNVSGTCTTGASTQAQVDFKAACETDSLMKLDAKDPEICICKPTGAAEQRLSLSRYLTAAGALDKTRFVADCKTGSNLICTQATDVASPAQLTALLGDFKSTCERHSNAKLSGDGESCDCPQASRLVNQKDMVACNVATGKFAVSQALFLFPVDKCPYNPGAGGFCAGKTAPVAADITASAKEAFGGRCSSFGGPTLTENATSCQCNSNTNSVSILTALKCDNTQSAWVFDPDKFINSPCEAGSGAGSIDCNKPTAEQNNRLIADLKTACEARSGTVVGTDSSCLCNAGGVNTISVEDIRKCDARTGFSLDVTQATWERLKPDFRACQLSGSASGGGGSSSSSSSGGTPGGGGGQQGGGAGAADMLAIVQATVDSTGVVKFKITNDVGFDAQGAKIESATVSGAGGAATVMPSNTAKANVALTAKLRISGKKKTGGAAMICEVTIAELNKTESFGYVRSAGCSSLPSN